MSPDVDPKEAPDEESASEDDLEALLAQAKAQRANRDLKGCFDTYKKAADLGSGEAEYAVALFHLSGGVVPQDLKEGAARLRGAAEKGSIDARVYLGNLYELGIHYKADPEKADVWYRNAARAAKIEDEPGSDEHARALAELGCARYVLALVESGAVADDEKTALLARAKSHGYGLRLRDSDAGDRATFVDALAGAEAAATEAVKNPSGAPAPLEPTEKNAPVQGPRERANTAPATPSARKKVESQKQEQPKAKKKEGPGAGAALAAFGYALLFVLTGVGAGYAAMHGAHHLLTTGHELPLLGKREQLVFPIVVGVVGILPTWLVYELGAVVKAAFVGAAIGGLGWVAWGTGQAAFHSARGVQAIAFGLAGFLAALLVLGLLGGTKRHVAARTR